MKPPLQTLILEIEDPHLLETIDDFCEMLHWRKDHYPEHTLRDFLQVAFLAPPDSISLEHIAVPRVIDQRMGKLQDHGMYPVCKALKNGDILDQHAKITLFSFLKKHFAELRKPPKKRRPGR